MRLFNRPLPRSLYPAFLAAVYALLGKGFLAVRIIQAVLGAVTCGLVFLLARRIFDSPRAGILAALAAVVSPALVAAASYVLTETLATFLLIGAVFLLLSGLDKQCRLDWWLAGILFGLASLVRPSILLLPFGLAVLLPAALEKARRPALAAGLMLGTLLAVAPWTARNYKVFHRFIPIGLGGGFNLWAGSYAPWDGDYNWRDLGAAEDLVAGLSQVEADRKYSSEAIKNIRANPGFYARLAFRKIGRFWLQAPGSQQVLAGWPAARGLVYLAHYLTLLLAAAGGAAAILRRRREAWLPFLVILYFTGIHVLMLALPRYHIPALPMVAVLAGGAAAGGGSSLARPGPETRPDA
ncbi:MAG TPA: glycosyltransferase family 39 protein [bacterium]|nr:glycosyltransferase family 39 protein [bacterium]